MDIKILLEKKKKELLSGINTTDPVASAYKLGAYNLCDEIFNVIDSNNGKINLNRGKVRCAIKEEPDSNNFNIITGDRDMIDECISFIDACYRDDKHMVIINAAKELYPELEWDYVLEGEYSYQELKVEYVYSSEGCFSVNNKFNE